MDQERPIEKSLRACARKRREEAGPPLELHPATRRLLQGEVAQRFKKDPSQPRSLPQLLLALCPKLVWGLAILMIVGVMAALLLPNFNKSGKESLLTKNDDRMLARPGNEAIPPQVVAPEAAPAPLNAPARQIQLADERLERHQESDALSLSTGRADAEGNRALTLSEPGVAQKRMTLADASRDTGQNSEARAAAPSARLSLKAESASANETFQRRYGLGGNLAPAQTAPAVPAEPPVVGGELAASSLEKSKLAFDGRPASIATDDLLKSGTEKPDLYKSPAAREPAGTYALAAPKNGAVSSYFAEDSKKGKDLVVGQRFTRVVPASKPQVASGTTSPGQPLLASFQVEQKGQNLRIVDKDGSVYDGYVQWADTVDRIRATQGDKSTSARALRPTEGRPEEKAKTFDDKQAMQNYFFRVAGTNRSLKEKVVFSGNLLAATNAVVFGQSTNRSAVSRAKGGGETPSAGPGAVPALQLINARISGKALVGDRGELEINAVPVAP